MESQNSLKQDIRIIAVGQLLCIGLMVGIFALTGNFALDVVWGGLMGGALATANFAIMSLAVNKAAEKAQQQDVAGGQKLISLSYTLRMALLFGALVLCALSHVFNLIALALPLAFNRPILMLAQYILKRKGDAQ